MKQKSLVICGLTVWALMVGGGSLWLADYSARPSRFAQAPLQWPLEQFPQLSQPRPSLLLFAHPHCPCTRATLAELARLVAHNRGRMSVQVFFYRPFDHSQEWVESGLWQQAKIIPDVQVATVSQLELLRFGISTSGQTLLYDANRKLVFSGGITRARGHEGDNSGREAISSYLQTGYLPTTQTPVFGCSLLDPESIP